MTRPLSLVQQFDQFIERCVHVLEARAAVHNVVGPRPPLGVGKLAREQMFELVHGHAGPRQHALPLHMRRRGQHDSHVDALLGAGLEQKRDLQHGELGACLLLLDSGNRSRPRPPSDARWPRAL